jgi:hypothetical protein
MGPHWLINAFYDYLDWLLFYLPVILYEQVLRALNH